MAIMLPGLTFTEMIKEVFMYRCPILYGGSAPEVFGNHVRSSDFIGLAQGELVNAHVDALRFKRN